MGTLAFKYRVVIHLYPFFIKKAPFNRYSNRIYPLFTVSLLFLSVFILSSCSIVKLPSYRTPKKAVRSGFHEPEEKISGKRNNIVRDAKSFVGKRRIRVENKSFNNDCSGLVAAVYFKNGYDLINGNPYGHRSLVRAIFSYINNKGEIYREKNPRPGDIVFFSNTYKEYGANELTHVGIVENVDTDGTITFIHRSSRGIVEDSMNTIHPSTRENPKNSKILNAYLRRKRRDDPPNAKYLAGELFEAYGRILD